MTRPAGSWLGTTDRQQPGCWRSVMTGVLVFVGSPERIRTAVTALRGRRPRPLDDGAVAPAGDAAGSGMVPGVRGLPQPPYSLARSRRARERALPSSAIDSNSGGLTRVPVIARRTGWNAFLGLRPRSACRPRSPPG